MADSSAKTTRILAVIHIIVGFLLICFGIAERVIDFPHAWTRRLYFGIWIGILICITGSLGGIPDDGRRRSGYHNAFVGLFMGLSITSAVLGGVIIIFYSMLINSYWYGYYQSWDRTSAVIASIILVLGIVELVIGIWTAICCCLTTCRGCGATPEQGQQVVYTQGPDGVPVAIPMQEGGGVVAVQASGTQGNQPPMVLVPMGNQPMTAQAAPTGGLFATGYQPQQEDKPLLYEI